MNIPKTNNPTEEQIEEAYRIVMKHDPETLLRVSQALQQGPEMRKILAYYIYHLYVNERRPVPEDVRAIINDLERIFKDFKTPIEEAIDVVTQADYLAYVKGHNLLWVAERLVEHDPTYPEDEVYEFIYETHTAENDFPTDRFGLCVMFEAWVFASTRDLDT